jgi:hypothetical protein
MPADAFMAGAPDGLAPAAIVSLPGYVPHDDYAWTHTPQVEGFFAVLTAIVVPVAIMRWTRRLRRMRQPAGRRRGRVIS